MYPPRGARQGLPCGCHHGRGMHPRVLERRREPPALLPRQHPCAELPVRWQALAVV